jgi:hypothetical protein
MYAIGSLEEDSPSVVILKTPFKEQVLQVLNECFDQVMKNEEGIVPVRLLAGTTEELIIELHAIGFSHDQHTKSTITLQLEVDETNSLPTFQDAYLWRIIDRNAQPTRISSFIQNYATDAIVSMEDAASRDRPKWLQDVLFFVRHPILDFDCSPFSFQYFNIKVSYAVIEKIVEDSFWSRGIVWNDLVLSTSFEDLFRLKYEIMCKWHPPASFIGA